MANIKTAPDKGATLQTIIDVGERMRFNVYPFCGDTEFRCREAYIMLPVEKMIKGEVYGGVYTVPIKVKSAKRYANNGVLSGKEINKWIKDNNYDRKKGNPIHVFEFEFKEKDGNHYYTLTRYVGRRLPGHEDLINE